MEPSEMDKLSAHRMDLEAIADDRARSIANVVIDADPARRSRSVRDADELSDEEAEAFFYA